MHNHSDNNSTGGHDSKMMWLMMIGCMLPILIIGLTGSGVGRGSIWVFLLVGGGMLALHWFMMRGHGSHNHKDDISAETVGNQPVVPPSTGQADSSTVQPTADTNPTKGGHNHSCCQ